MKKILNIIYILCLFAAMSIQVSASSETESSSAGGINAIEVRITEVAPFMDNCTTEPDSDGFYTCTITPGIDYLLVMGGKFIKWATFITLLLGVLFIIVYGILYSMSGFDENAKNAAKDKIKNGAFGVILLLLSGVILNTFFPWIYVL